jgi:3-phosphoshikimate 1-carboxyvinyltransferase
MKVTIRPSTLKGTIQAPPSKSSMQRACAAALLCKGTSRIQNPGNSDDDKAAIAIIKALGAKVVVQDVELIVESAGINPVANELDCRESGLSVRMFAPIAALGNKKITITGQGSMLNRPVDFFDEILPKLGVKTETNHGNLPVTVQGPLIPKNIELDGSMSSQFLTGLLMAYSAAGANDVVIKVNRLTSKPYIDLTLDVMKKFGMKIPENKNYKEFFFQEEPTRDHMEENKRLYTVEGDWSSGAFLLVAGALAGHITVRGLDLSSAQADKAVVDALMSAHAAIAMEAKGIKIHPGGLKRFELDATDCPDLFPPLVALAAYCTGTSMIKGASRLVYKESNRAAALQEEFGKMGVQIELNDDIMIIHGISKLKGTTVHSHHDHRIAMACAVAALQADGDTVIEEAQAVKKSYPGFFTDLLSLGASVSLPFKLAHK